ncbi:MAG: mannose-6-phosphate isomerase-like protein (cupin superfamily) [Alphaproteobacteria bacterium]|jgi:mannose-6-phosphate isomerase-like protein (cupin superfamily)
MSDTSDTSDITVMSLDEMRERIAVFEDQTASQKLIITQSIPGFKRDIYSIIGRGVSEDAETRPAIVDSSGFNIAYVGAEPGNGSALHTHPEVEVFIPFSGQWSVFWNEGDAHQEVVIGPMDCISVPPGVMRAFRNVGKEYGHLMAIIGGTENAAVGRPQDVVDAAAAAGLKLDADGHLVEAAE